MSTRSFRIGLVALLLMGCTGCCLKPWQKFDMPKPPETSCFEVGAHGWTIYAWECLDGQHVVIGQYSAEMTCEAAIRETSACGQHTPLEREHVDTGICKMGPDTRWKH